MNLLKFLPEWFDFKNKPTQDQILRREQELGQARARMGIVKSKEYPTLKNWLYWKMFRYLEEAQSKKDLTFFFKAEAIDEIINEIESAEKFVLAEEKNLENLKNKEK